MEEPKTIKELTSFVREWIVSQNTTLSDLELDVVVEVVVAPVQDDAQVPAFYRHFNKYYKKWPLNKGGIA